MRFQKISNNSIRCIITRSEMDERGLEIDDLMDNREKAEGFLRYILDEARDAVDFRTSGNVLNVQLSIMPDGDISLILSDDADSAIRSMLSEMKNHLEALKTMASDDSSSEEKKNDPMLWIPEELKAVKEPEMKDEVEEEEKVESSDDILTLPLWCKLDDLEGCIHLAKMVPSVREVPSRMFRYEDAYYIEMMLTMTRRNLAGVAIKVSEYASGMYPDLPGLLEIIEHGKLIIADKAMKQLYELV